MKLIEFFGLPGSGKTSVLPFVKSLLQKRGDRIYDKRELKLLYIFRYKFLLDLITVLPEIFGNQFIKRFFDWKNIRAIYKHKFIEHHPTLVESVLQWTSAHSISVEEQNMVCDWFFNTAAFYEIAEEILEPTEFFIIDEGLIQRVLSLFVSVEKHIYSEDIESYLESIPDVELLIYICTDISVSMKRLVTRGKTKRLKKYGQKEIEVFLNRSKSTLDIVLDYYQKKEVKVLQLDNSLDFTDKKSFSSNIINKFS